MIFLRMRWADVAHTWEDSTNNRTDKTGRQTTEHTELSRGGGKA